MAPFTPKQCLPPSPAVMAELGGDCPTQVARKTVSIVELKPGSIVHDNACGNGVVTLAIIDIKKPSEATIHATDLNPKMCEVTAAQAASKGWTVTTAEMPAEALTFEDNFLSHSFSNFVIQFFEEGEIAKNVGHNIYRTLKPGGTAILTSWATTALVPAVLAAHTAIRGPDVFHGMSKVGWKDPLTLDKLLRDAGFTDVRMEQFEAVLVVQDLKRYCLIAWSWFGGNCDGGWREEDERRFQEAVDIIHDRLLKTEGIVIDGKGGARSRNIANIAIGKK